MAESAIAVATSVWSIAPFALRQRGTELTSTPVVALLQAGCPIYEPAAGCWTATSEPVVCSSRPITPRQCCSKFVFICVGLHQVTRERTCVRCASGDGRRASGR
jgi:hypothetical protein